jgi:hypothetical protein
MTLRPWILSSLLSVGCSGGAVHNMDVAPAETGADAAADTARVDTALDVAMDVPAADTGPHCFMVHPPAMCGDGVCDPGCESPIDCPADCPIPDGGLPCTGTPSVWTCNANGTARYVCYHGQYHFDLCPAAGACHTIVSPWPAQCHACMPCNGWNSASPAIGQPFVWSCINAGAERVRCVDTSTGGDCVMGRSDPTHCCVLDDVCVGGGCVGTPLGHEDYCPM